MSKVTKTKKSGQKRIIIKFALSALSSVAVSLVLLLLVAFLLYKSVIDITAVPVINTVIRVISAGVGAFICSFNMSKRWLLGLLGGALYALLAFVIYSVFSRQFVFNYSVISDFLVCTATGILVGMISNLLCKQPR